MSATVIVPTWQGADRLEALLSSLARQTADHQLLVVDNGSSDGTSEILSSHPAIDVIRLERNVGFSRAVNLAAERADGDALVLVNDDCVCDPGFVEAITRPLAGQVVMAAGVLRDQADERLIDTAGMELDPTLLVFDYLHGEELDGLNSVPAPIGPSAAAAAFDRAAFLEAGGFDEALFAYWEDVDLVLRLRLAGGTCALAADAQGTHMHSASLGSGSPEKNRLMGFGRGYVLRKWSVMRGPRALRVLAEDGAICLGQALIDRNLASASSRVRGFRAAEPSFGYPGDLLQGHAAPGMLENLGRRLRRRRHIRRSRLETESPREGLERSLGELTIPSRVFVGAGQVVFVGGRIEAVSARPKQAQLLVDGVAMDEPVNLVAPGGETPAYWWTLLPLTSSTAVGERTLSLRLEDGGPGAVVELGCIEAEPGPTRTAGLDPLRLSQAIAAAGAQTLIAICMATYEPSMDLFTQQVRSIKTQTHANWICLISDDGSSPERLAAMRESVGDDPRFVFLENEGRLGFYGNYERVLVAVPPEADLVALADQDDRWYPEKLESLLAALGDRDLAYADMRVVGADGALISETYWNRRRNNYTDLASLLVGNTVTGAASLFRADLLNRALPFPIRRSDSYHDHWIALTAMTGRGLTYVDRPLQDYIQHGEAAQGHAEANAGARYLQPGLIGILAWQGVRAMLGGRRGKGWADRYFGMYTRTVIWARILLMRSAGSLTKKQARILERVAAADRSPAALAWLAGRSLRPLWGANEAFGREILVLSSVLWGRALQARSRFAGPAK